MKTKKIHVTSLALGFSMLFSSMLTVPTYAAELDVPAVEETTEIEVKTVTVPEADAESVNDMVRSGPNETLPIGSYTVGSFTFTDTNITPVKIPAGRFARFTIAFKKASIDAGLGNVKLKFNIRDASTGAVISPTYVAEADPTNQFLTLAGTDVIDLGYARRPIQVWFDASSTGQSNGNFRSIEVAYYISHVSN